MPKLKLIRVWGKGWRGYSRGRWWGVRQICYGQGLVTTQWAAWPTGSCLEDGGDEGEYKCLGVRAVAPQIARMTSSRWTVDPSWRPRVESISSGTRSPFSVGDGILAFVLLTR